MAALIIGRVVHDEDAQSDHERPDPAHTAQEQDQYHRSSRISLRIFPEKVFPISESEFSKVWPPLVNEGKGKMPGMEWHSDYHTNSLVPFFAKGYGSLEFKTLADEEDPVHGLYADNAEIGRLLIDQIKK